MRFLRHRVQSHQRFAVFWSWEEVDGVDCHPDGLFFDDEAAAHLHRLAFADRLDQPLGGESPSEAPHAVHSQIVSPFCLLCGQRTGEHEALLRGEF